ncbi:zinc-ribbon domain-containing protein [Massilicoli timonensis]|uniref:zinc-ribbon domain-containing protein n=1 Tax=Massilicoli timonensis TaxID=2015901 RepID=UPI000C846562|nr:zinc-ribbon domain-containing protein [Massilicoli timonensis]
MKVCMNCGKELNEDDKFCSNCGKSTLDDNSKRKTVYEGEIHKCPNCGNTINAYEMVCTTCGHEIRGRQITSQVHKLSLKLENTNNVQKKRRINSNFLYSKY